ncbi:ECF transporter S component [Glycomyces arizonensis]|uniref:ECF transporter S component n=1 Tax=Glycomyces arizonensis TaxID=256035 RepID=UPI00041D3270|nr:ECF transporter S component [Glycomyces arizonensis]
MPTADSPALAADPRWRTLDIVTCAVLAVAFGVVFWAWNFAWAGLEPALAFLLPLKGVLYGVWLIPAVLAPLIVRRIGAALFTEFLAATFSLLLGSAWGILIMYQGLFQGAGGELAFAAGRYRRFGTPTALAAGALAGFAATLYDVIVYYPSYELWAFQVPYIAFAMLSGAVVAGLGSKALVRAMLPTGVLDRFPAGRDRARV